MASQVTTERHLYSFNQLLGKKKAAARLDLGWMIRCRVWALGFSSFFILIFTCKRPLHSFFRYVKKAYQIRSYFYPPGLKKKKERDSPISAYRPVCFQQTGNGFLILFLLSFILFSSALASKNPG